MERNGIVPSEAQEQEAFVQWCKIMDIRVHHSANEIGGSSTALKVRAIKMKKMGTSKGFPDLMVFVPITNSEGTIEAYQALGIEMKRRKGSTTSPEQIEWLRRLEMSGIPSKICKGADEAIAFVEQYMVKW